MARGEQEQINITELVSVVLGKARLYEALIQGVQTLLWHRQPVQSYEAQKLVKGVETETAVQRELRTWREKLHWDTDSNVVIPQDAIKKSIPEGSRKLQLKVGKTSLATILEGALRPQGPMQILDAQMSRIPKDSALIEPFEAMVTIQRSKVLRVRPSIQPPWFGLFQVMVLDERISVDSLARAIIAHGAYSGFGDYRKSYGSYQLVSIEQKQITLQQEVKGESIALRRAVG